MFLQNCWYMAAWDYELIDHKLLGRRLLNKAVVMYRGDDGKLVALEDQCAHRGARLSDGRREGNCIRCMYHGLVYDASGTCVEIPGQERIPPNLKVKSYPIVEKQHIAWIWMGDAAKADASRIPDFPYLADPRWSGKAGYLHYDANYLLVVDNLCDVTHMAWVHTHTLCGTEKYAYQSRITPLDRYDRGVRVTRWHLGAPLAPFVRKVVESDAPVDRWNSSQMQIPGVFFLESGFVPAGSEAAKAHDKEACKQVPGVHWFENIQIMTPETDRTSHFFFDYMHQFGPDRNDVTLSLYDSMWEGFNEDINIITHQQEILDRDPDFQFRAIANDGALSHFRWALGKLINDEQPSGPLKAVATA